MYLFKERRRYRFGQDALILKLSPSTGQTFLIYGNLYLSEEIMNYQS